MRRRKNEVLTTPAINFRGDFKNLKYTHKTFAIKEDKPIKAILNTKY